MRRLTWLVLLACLTLLGVSTTVNAATDSEALIINAQILSRTKLAITPTTINFADADPDVTDPVAATENAVTVTVKTRTSSGGNVTLTCLAQGDLQAGGDLIAIDNVTWNATGAGFVNGILNDAADQNVGSWTGSGQRTGSLDFFLVNSWSYNVGNYSQTVDYTLTAP